MWGWGLPPSLPLQLHAALRLLQSQMPAFLLHSDCKQGEACGIMFNFFVMPVALSSGVAFSVHPKALCGSA